MTDNKLGAYNIADLRDMARGHLPRAIFELLICQPNMTYYR